MKSNSCTVGLYIGNVNIGPQRGGMFSFTSSIIESIIDQKTSDINFVLIHRQKTVPIGEGINQISLRNDIWLHCVKVFGKLISEKIAVGLYAKHFEKKMKKNGIQVLLFINQDYLPSLTMPYIYVVVDLGHKTTFGFPEFREVKQFEIREKVFTAMVPKAERVITGNLTGKEEICVHYHVNPDKIRIIPFAVTPLPGDEKVVESVRQLNRPFVVYPAQFWAHKNHVTAIKMAAFLKRKNCPVVLVLTGSDKGNLMYVKKMVADWDVSDRIIFLGFVETKELVWLYKNAVALTYFSALGPNNIPPLEAMSVKCPVIASDIKGHIEQLGDAAIYARTFDAQDWCEKVISLYSHNEIRSALIEKGSNLVNKLTYQNYTESLLTVVGEVTEVRQLWE